MKKFFFILLVIFIIPIIFLFLIQFSGIQTFLAKKTAHYFSEELNSKIEIEKLDIDFFNLSININVFLLETPEKDTLVFFKNLDIEIENFFFNKNELFFKKIYINHLSYYLSFDKNEIINLEFLIDYFSSDEIKKDTTSSKYWKIYCENFDLENTYFSYHVYNPPKLPNNLNYDDILVKKMDLKIQNLYNHADTLKFEIENLSIKEKCGLFLDNLRAKTLFHSQIIALENLNFNLNNSTIKTNFFNFEFKTFSDFLDFNQKVVLNSDLRFSEINTKDIAFFSEALNGWNQSLVVAGKIKGSVSDMRGKNIKVHLQTYTTINADFHIHGLPEVDSTLWSFRIKKLKTHTKDWKKIQIYPFDENKYLTVNKEIQKLKKIKFKGNFTGYFDDFVTDGKIETIFGDLLLDIQLKPSNNQKSEFRGKIQTIDYKVDSLLKKQFQFGTNLVNLDFNINGFIDKNNDIDAFLKGKISSFVFKNYLYKDIIIESNFVDNKLNSFVDFRKANKNLNGQIILGADFSKEIPVYKIKSQMNNFVFFPFDLMEDSIANFSYDLLKAEIKADDIENLQADIFLENLYYENKNSHFELPNFHLIIEEKDSIKQINLKSNFVDLNLKGKFKYFNLQKITSKLLNNYLPAFFHQKTDTLFYLDSLIKENYFALELDLKKTKTIFPLFVKDFLISENSKLELNFYKNKNLELAFNTSHILYDDFDIHDFKTNLIDINKKIYLKNTAEKITFSEDFSIKNLVINTQISSDSIENEVIWDNENDLYYHSNLKFATHFFKKNNDFPKINISVQPSVIFLIDTLWDIQNCSLEIDNNLIDVRQFKLNNNKQSFCVNGIISDKKTDTLALKFNKFSLQNLNVFIPDLDLKGHLEGNLKLTDLYNEISFLSDLHINNFKVNKENFGDAYILSNWNNHQEKLFLDVFSLRGESEIFKIKGNFLPKKSLLDFDTIRFNNLKLKILEPYLTDILSEITGYANANLTLKGNLENPILQGQLRLSKTSFILDYLQTKYNFSGIFEVDSQSISFDSISIAYILPQKKKKKNALFIPIPLPNKKIKKGSAILSGKVLHRHFDNFKFSADIQAKNFLLLNTKAKDNDLFYGQAFGSGLVNISGTTDNIFLNIALKTEKNTKLYIPLSSGSEANEYHFMTFVKKDTFEIIDELTYNTPNDILGMDLSFNFDVTPDAEVQLIFDEKKGDIIKGQGKGNIKMDINSFGGFSMYGDYTITKGDYLFTLMNITSKKFKVAEGGTIKWNGDPYNAIIDLNAIYDLRASPVDLMAKIDTSDIYKKKIPVSCELKMSNTLLKPNIDFGISVSSLDEKLQNQIASLPQEEINKQILSLLVLSRFFASDFQNTDDYDSENKYNVAKTTSELLSNQLSHWLSQISNDLDIGVNYRPGDELTTDEVEVALSTQILNDRVTINGNMGVAGNNNQSNQFIGDMDINIKLNKSGKLKLKAYTKTNPNLIYDDVLPYTQGIGIFYKEDFNSVGELFSKYKKKLIKIFK